MALNFPISPTLNQVYTSGNSSWTWDGTSWKSSSSGLSGYSGYSGYSGTSGFSGISGYSGSGISGYSGFSGISGFSGSGISGYSGSGISGYSGFSGKSGYSGSGISGYSGFSGISGFSGSGVSGYSGFSGISGFSGVAGSSTSLNATADTTTAALYPAMVSALGSNQTIKANTTLAYNATTGELSATKFLGDGSALTGITSGATITDDITNNSTHYIVITDLTSGSMTSVNVSTTKLYYNPSTGTLSATNFNSLSDATLKKEVSQIDSAVTTLKKIDGVEFTWKDNNKKSYGVIAQEIEKILPDVVETNDQGIKSVNYAAMAGFFIQAIKELSAEIEALKTNK